MSDYAVEKPTPDTPTPILALRGIEKAFADRPVLRGVEWELSAGGVAVLMGPNGAGKTTLLRIACGWLRADAGQVALHGEVITHGLLPNLRRAIGLLSHTPLLTLSLTLRENMRDLGRLYGMETTALETRIVDLAEKYALSDAIDRPVRTYSRGMSQRAALIRAILHDPPVLLLDEPFTGLDPKHATQLSEQIAAWKSEGRAIAMVTHDVANAVELGSSIHVLSSGRLFSPPQEETDAAALRGSLQQALSRAR